MTGWELLRAARDGDRDAFDEFYRRYRPVVAGFLHSRGIDRDTVEDLTSEVFLRAWRYLDTVTEQRDDPAAWLFTIARNQALDLVKSAHHRRSEPVAEIPEPRRPDTGAGRLAPSAEDVALAAIERTETTAHVRSTIARLNRLHRQAVAAVLAERGTPRKPPAPASPAARARPDASAPCARPAPPSPATQPTPTGVPHDRQPSTRAARRTGRTP